MKRLLALFSLLALVLIPSSASAYPVNNAGGCLGITGQFCVSDFGAKGDGVNDDSARIQQTINAAVNAGQNAEVYLPSATYIIGTAINVPSNVALRGQGAATVLQAKNALNTPVITSSASTSNVRLSSLQVSGNNTNQSNTAANGIYLTGSDVTVEHVLVTSAYNDGLQLETVNRGNVLDVTATNNGRHGINVTGSSKYVSITAPTIYNNGQLFGNGSLAHSAGEGDGVAVGSASLYTTITNVRGFDTQINPTQGYGVRETGSANFTVVSGLEPSTLAASGQITGTSTFAGASSQDLGNNLTAAGTATLTNKTINCAAGGNVCQVNGNTLTASSGSGTVTVPAVTDTLVGKATTDTLTNKSIAASQITSGTTAANLTVTGNTDLSGAAVTTGLKLPSGAGAAPTADGQLAFDTTAHAPVAGFNGTKRQLASLDGTETLTNKTLTTPVISSISNTGTVTLPTTTTTLGPALITFGTSNTQTSTTDTKFFGSGLGAANANVALPLAAAVTITKFYVSSQAAPGGGQTFTYTLEKNGSDTALTCVTSGASATSCNDTAHSAAFVAGDLLAGKVVTSGSAASSTHTASVSA